jgi:hypothetical protein
MEVRESKFSHSLVDRVSELKYCMVCFAYRAPVAIFFVQCESVIVVALEDTKAENICGSPGVGECARGKENGYWGAISKTNHAVLQFRDPVYKTVRELALSYFHEYFLTKNGIKTLRGYSRPISLKHFGTSWMTSSEPLFEIAEAIYDARHSPIIPKGNEKLLRKATLLERKTASISCDGR